MIGNPAEPRVTWSHLLPPKLRRPPGFPSTIRLPTPHQDPALTPLTTGLAIRLPATQKPTIFPPWRKHHPDQTRPGGRLNLRPNTSACPLLPRSGERISEP